jgi:hypothetical protein
VFCAWWLAVDVVGRTAGQFLAHGGGQHFFHVRYLGHVGWRGAMIGNMGSAVGSDAVAGGVAGPGAGGIVSHPRLFERLAAPARVAVVSAPRGSGKTVLLRSWISQAGSAAWVPVGRTVAEYLLAEVLDRQRPQARLLLRTSVLERVNGERADLMTGGSGGERALQDLEEANAFFVALDAARSRFRYGADPGRGTADRCGPDHPRDRG